MIGQLLGAAAVGCPDLDLVSQIGANSKWHLNKTAATVCMVASKCHQGELVPGCWRHTIDERERYPNRKRRLYLDNIV